MKVAESSFIHFIYPFAFDAQRTDLRHIARGESDHCGREAAWERKTVPASGVLLGVQAFFDPAPGRKPQATLWTFAKSQLESSDGLGAGTMSTWALISPKRQIHFRLDDVGLALFAQGIGLLTLRVVPQTAEVAEWLDFLHFGRLISRPRVMLSMRRRAGLDASRGEVQWQAFFPGLAGGLAQHPDGQGNFLHIIEALLRTVTANEVGENWWQEIFVPGQMISYAVLFVQGMPPDGREELMYRLENCFSADRVIHPVESAAESDLSALDYAEGQKFLFSLDGTSFVAFDPPATPFFRETLPANLASAYLLAFQIALFQRFLLMRLADDISHCWTRDNAAGIRKREELLRDARDRLLSFTAGGYFSQVTQVQRQHACYRRWQECFGVPELYERTRQAVSDMHDYLVQQRDEQRRDDFQKLDMRLRQIALVLGPPALCLSFVGILAYTKSWLRPSVALVGGLLLGWLAWWLVKRSHRA